MIETNYNINFLNSSAYADLNASINHSKDNKITLDNISYYYNMEDGIIFGMNILKKYEHIIKAFTVPYKLNKKFCYRPEYVSYDAYATTDLWYLVMFVNDFTSVEELKGEEIKIFDPNMLGLFNNLIESERNSLKSHYNPVKLKKHFLKKLDEPSKRILPKEFEQSIPPVTETPKVPFKVRDFKHFYNNLTDIKVKGKILQEHFDYDIENDKYYLSHKSLIQNIFLNNVNFFSDLDREKSKFKKIFKGYYFNNSNGNQTFKILSTGDVNLNINGNSQEYKFNELKKKELLNIPVSKLKNLQNGVIEIDKETNKEMVHLKLDKANESLVPIFDLTLDNKIFFERDLLFNLSYKSLNKENLIFNFVVDYHFNDGKVETIKNNGKTQNFNNTEIFVNNMLVLPEATSQLKSINVRCFVTRDTENAKNRVLTGEVFIQNLSVIEIEYPEFNMELRGSDFCDFELEFENKNVYPYLSMYVKRDEYELVPSSNFYFNLSNYNDKELLDYTIFDHIYSMDNKSFLTSRLSSSFFINYNEDIFDPYVPEKSSVIIKRNCKFRFRTNRKFKLVGNKNDNIKAFLTINGEKKLWLEKVKGKTSSEEEYFNYGYWKDIELDIILEHTYGNGNIFMDLRSNPDHFYNEVWETYSCKNARTNIFQIYDWIGVNHIEGTPRNQFDYSVSLNSYADGLTKFINYKYRNLRDFDFSSTFYIDDNNSYKGLCGIIFRSRSDSEFYMLVINKHINEKNIIDSEQDTERIINNKKIIVPSGLYKVSPLLEETSLCFDNRYKLPMKLLCENKKINYKEQEQHEIKIKIVKNKIHIEYDNEIIDYEDVENPILMGSFGFISLYQTNLKFKNLSCNY